MSPLPPYNTSMNLDSALALLSRDRGAPLDLAELALLLARDEYPGLDVEAYLGELAAMAHEARNSSLNEVLDRRTGIPITLSAVAMAVGTRAGLEVVGVGLPGHFVAKALGDGEEVLFDPFHGGRLLEPEQCQALVEQVTGQPFELTTEALAPAPLGLIVQRMLNNLKGAYLRGGDFPRAARVLDRLHQL